METGGVELKALYNRTGNKARQLAERFGIDAFYDNAERLLDEHELDFVDIITDVDTHALFTGMAAARGIPVICQKPMAPRFTDAAGMLAICDKQDVPLYIHENFRWQAPIRRLKEFLDGGVIGKPFHARISFCSGFPVFDNQPFLRELEHFILTDIGSHILDVTRFLFGEAETLHCSTFKINKAIKGEDAAYVTLRMASGVLCSVEMSYASILPREVFPQTLVVVEGEQGSLTLGPDYKICIATRERSYLVEAPPAEYPWLDPLYTVVHSSIVGCNQNLLSALQGAGTAETTGRDNLETVRLVWAAYASARENKLIHIQSFTP